MARKFGWTIVPCGDTALNLLGLSTQVPAVWSYVSDGTYKEYTFDKTTVKFKKTTNKEISKLSYKTALMVQALKALGKENVTDAVLTKLKKGLTTAEKRKCSKKQKPLPLGFMNILRKYAGAMKHVAHTRSQWNKT